MKANELRIGNKVGFYKPLISELQVGTVTTLGEIDVTIPEFSKSVDLSFNGITGIPLTEEWLLKFGFVLSQKEASFGYSGGTFPEYRIGTFSIILKDGYYKLWIELEDDWYNFEWTEISNVHQLQNLYFALTGEELTLK